ncbi:MAG: T9SS type A sorting domain-containing protein, partial [Ferruginibacter sp.]
PLTGDNFYRVKSVGVAGETRYSQIVKVNMIKTAGAITVFPNPIRKDGLVYVNMTNQPAGIYHVRIINNEGQTMLNKLLNHAGGSIVYTVELERLVAHGNYLLSVVGEDNVNLSFRIVY